MTSDSQSLSFKPSGHVQADLKKLGKYRIVRRIGAGGMGTVYLAEDTLLGRTVALKVLPKERAENPILIRRFQSEARASAMLTHDNIVSVFDADQADGYLYIALEFVDGIDLHQWMKKRERIPVKRSINIIKQVAAALQHAHEKKLVHRDIKPANIMIAKDGTVKLADMGLARSIDETLDTTITRAGTTVGTVDYMSPEQAANSKHADIRSDIYSLGCTWFHMLTGTPPYPEGDLTNKLRAHSEKPIPDPRDFNDSVSEALVAVIHRMMSKKKQDRYQTPDELLDDLNNTPNLEADSNQLLATLLAEEEDDEMSFSSEDDDSLDFVVQEETQSKLLKKSEYPTAPSTSLNVPKRGKEKAEQSDDKLGAQQKQRPPKRTQNEEESAEPVTQETPIHRQPLKRVRSAEELHEPEPIAPTPRKRKSAPEKKNAFKSDSKKSAKKKNSQRPKEQNKPQSIKNPTKANPAKKKKAALTSKSLGKESRSSKKSAPVSISLDWRKAGGILIGIAGVIALFFWGYSKFGGDSGIPLVNPYDETSENGTSKNSQDLALNEEGVSSKSEKDRNLQNQSGNSQTTGDRDARQGLPPRWVIADRERPKDTNVERFRVQRGQKGRSTFLNLSQAIHSVSDRSCNIELPQELYDDLQPVSLSLKERLTIRGGGEGSVLTYRAISQEETELPKPWLRVEGGALELVGLNFMISNSSKHPLEFLQLDGTDLILRDCTFTSLSDASTTLAAIQGKSSNGNQILIDNCLIRGDHFSAVNIKHVSCDLYCHNSLLISKSDPLVRVGVGPGKVDQHLQISNSTFCGGTAGIQFVGQDQGQSFGNCRLDWQRSISIGQAAPSAAIQLVNIPAKESTKQVSLKTQHVLFFNQPVLTEVVVENVSVESVLNVEKWKSFWKTTLPGSDVIEVEQAGDLFKNPVLVTAADVSERLKEFLEPGAGERSQLGVDFESVATIEPVAVERQQVLEKISHQVAQHQPMVFKGKTVRFDLSRADRFPKFLASPECPDGTTVICYGAGVRTLPPVTLTNRRLRIRFEQSSGMALTVSPKSVAQAAPMFLVEGGEVQIEEARVELRATNTESPSPLFLKVRQGGSVQIVRSQISQRFNKTNPRTLIAFEANSTSQHNLVSIESSMLSSPGPLVSLDATNQSIQLVDSILVSGADAMTMKGETPVGFVDVKQSTFSHAKAAFATTGSQQPIVVFVSDSVFAPSITDPSESSILKSDSLKTLRASLQWWDISCAYAPQIQTPILVPEERLPGSFPVAWKSFWGPHHVMNPLYGPRAIIFDKKIDDVDKLAPQDFQIAGSSESAIWSATGTPIGATISTIGPREGGNSAEKSSKPGRVNTPKGF
ncbi:serine/threonine protein kinase [Thalassoglobus polymorphus]|uniref:non-specific serine/threonine protein kinase n=1 Tax=Thalassoglobus polymorphus TaxID=2527994 RepID=A0A517QUZ0_9PLAN|nr:serine/threonine-protein kinase [Thalassoglobus polymorphus]QDT35455.1 Serine/threonine-protein kinase StkP [Thalassoglobus polymorphus]